MLGASLSTWRVVQRGRGPLVACYLVGDVCDPDLRAALPGAPIVARSDAPLTPTRPDIDGIRTAAGADSRTVLVGWSAGCQPIRYYLRNGLDASAVVCLDGTSANYPTPEPWQIDTWAMLANSARRGETVFVATCTQQSYVEQLRPTAERPNDHPYMWTRHVLQRAIGQDIPPGFEVHDGGLHVFSHPSASIDGAAHIREVREHMPELLRRYIAPIYGDALPDTEPMPAVVGGTLGERCVVWCEAELAAGVREEPAGSNTSPRIREYLAPAYRRATGQLLGLSSGAWCAAAQSFAQRSCLLAGEAGAHGYYASGVELAESAKEVGTWREPGWTPRRGDLCVLVRAGSDPATASWERHVVRVVDVRADGTWISIGGNEADRWRYTTRRLDDAAITGWIEYPA